MAGGNAWPQGGPKTPGLHLCPGDVILRIGDEPGGDISMKQSTQRGDTLEDAPGARDWRKAMSDHVAYALLVYTGLQIFVTVHALEGGSSTILPYLALVVQIGRAHV